MEKLLKLEAFFQIKAYFLLTKPGIILGNAITASGGFFLASQGRVDFELFFATLLGLSLVMASACVFNNYIDRKMDKKMKRTQNRILARGLLPLRKVIIFATGLFVFGAFLLAFWTPFLAFMTALLGFFVYVIIYSFLKYQSVHATLVGSISGAVPPVVGYLSANFSFDAGAFILFIMMTTWQMPHFFSIAMYRIKDYAAASIPVLPLKKGSYTTKVQMFIYILAFMNASFMLTILGYTKYPYLVTMALLSLIWLWLCFKGFTCDDDKAWARQMFRFSLVVVTTFSLMISLKGSIEI